MRKLDKDEDYGWITPPWRKKEWDRAAHFDQNGRFFDQHGLEIIAGQPLDKVETEEKVKEVVVKAKAVPISPPQLIAAAKTMPWPKFHKEARRILGKDCPSNKAAIVDALQAAIAAYEARQSKRHKGKAEAAVAPIVTAPAKPAPKANGKTTVDLRAWGSGQKEYRSAEVIKAVRDKYSLQVGAGDHWRRDVVELLITEKVISAAQARRDV
jgi:hypothetical protein